MSHFTKVKTKINHLPSLYAALDKLGYRYTIAGKHPAKVVGYVHQAIDAKVSIHTAGSYDIGIVEGEDGNYEIAADWWGLESTLGRTEREMIDEIAREYSLARVTSACQEAGWDFEGQPEVNQETGEVEVVACQWN